MGGVSEANTYQFKNFINKKKNNIICLYSWLLCKVIISISYLCEVLLMRTSEIQTGGKRDYTIKETTIEDILLWVRVILVNVVPNYGLTEPRLLFCNSLKSYKCSRAVTWKRQNRHSAKKYVLKSYSIGNYSKKNITNHVELNNNLELSSFQILISISLKGTFS